MGLFFNKNALKNKWQHYKVLLSNKIQKIRPRPKGVMSPAEKVDESGRLSFPASDPPAHSATSQEKTEIH